ncbi:MAG: hypothetical protein WBR13_12500 [Allosphingosinicella sp.]
MSQRLQNEIEEAAAKAHWTRPQVERLIAGGAEGAADISTDGLDVPS